MTTYAAFRTSDAYGFPGMKDRPTLRSLIKCAYNPKTLIESVCEFFNISENDLKKRQRYRRFCFPRQIIMFLLRTETTMTLKDIGECLSLPGKKVYDHTTVIHSTELIRDLMRFDKDVLETVNRLKEFV